ncbi:pyruvate kinase alpha/beta domain-containing protein [Geotalea toluenoxydans]
MLSGETASGAYPIEAVRTMAKIALDIEHAELWRIPAIKQVHSDNVPEAVAEASCHAASTLKAKALVVFTQSGNTAALISKFRPQLPIIAFTPFPEIQRRLALYWGVKSYPVGSVGGTRQQIKVGEETLMTTGFRKGDLVVVSMGVPLEAKGSTNLMKVHRLGTEGYYEIF